MRRPAGAVLALLTFTRCPGAALPKAELLPANSSAPVFETLAVTPLPTVADPFVKSSVRVPPLTASTLLLPSTGAPVRVSVPAPVLVKVPPTPGDDPAASATVPANPEVPAALLTVKVAPLTMLTVAEPP